MKIILIITLLVLLTSIQAASIRKDEKTTEEDIYDPVVLEMYKQYELCGRNDEAHKRKLLSFKKAPKCLKIMFSEFVSLKKEFSPTDKTQGVAPFVSVSHIEKGLLKFNSMSRKMFDCGLLKKEFSLVVPPQEELEKCSNHLNELIQLFKSVNENSLSKNIVSLFNIFKQIKDLIGKTVSSCSTKRQTRSTNKNLN